MRKAAGLARAYNFPNMIGLPVNAEQVVRCNGQSLRAGARVSLSVLRTATRPVHEIADDLLPYLQVLVDEFEPQRVVLFGSYAHGTPDAASDVDLLIIKKIQHSPVADAIEIRRRWSSLRKLHRKFAFDLLVESIERHADRLASGGAFYQEIVQNGLELYAA